MSEQLQTSIESPFEYANPVVPPIFAGRAKEIKLINHALFHDKESMVIYGNDAIGKSSLVSTIYLNQVRKETSGIFPVRISAFDFIQAVDSNFLGVTTHQICAAIWTTILGRKYSELIEDTAFRKEGIINTPAENTIRRILRIVTSEKNVATGKANFDIGGKFIIEGKSTTSSEFVNERKPLASFEFLLLLDELTGIVREYGYQSIMVFCDELNHFPEKTNTEILRNYFNIFYSQKIQFVLVVLSPEITTIEYGQEIIDSFNYKIGIGSFKSIHDANELIENCINSIKSEVVFEEAAIAFIYEKTNGQPWWIQKICDAAFQRLIEHKLDKVGLYEAELAFKKFADEISFYREQIAQGRPFRKHLLYSRSK